MHVDTLLIIYICVSIGLVCMEIIIDVLLLFFTSTILWLFEYIFVSVTVPRGKEFFFIFHVFIDIHKTLSDNYCVCLCSVTQSCLTLCDPCRAPLSMEFSRQETGVGCHFLLLWAYRVWVNSGRWWWTGRPDMLQSVGSQRVRHDWTEVIREIREGWAFWAVEALRYSWNCFCQSLTRER